MYDIFTWDTYISRLLDDFEQAESEEVFDEAIKLVARSLRQSRDALATDPKNLPVQLVGRLATKVEVDEAIDKLVSASIEPHFDCYVTTQGETLICC